MCIVSPGCRMLVSVAKDFCTLSYFRYLEIYIYYVCIRMQN